MSTKLTGYVWDGCAASGMKLSSVAIMARLADFSNDEGVCWPSIETIARQIGAGMSTVRTAIARLEAEGWLTRKARRQGSGMTTLTQCQQQVLDMLISYQKERGFPPTNQEVATMLGYRSVNAAVEHLRALEKKGVITIKRGVARGITLHTAVKDDDSEAVGIIRSLLAGEENARLRAAHWLHERGLKV